MSKLTSKPITGQCHCGDVKYRANGPIIHQGDCDCRACQRATGTLSSQYIDVKQDDFQVVQGIPGQYKSTGDQVCEAGIFNFCGKCGAPLFWKSPDGDRTSILVGSLDVTSLYKTAG
jgi:hypothetical protein